MKKIQPAVHTNSAPSSANHVAAGYPLGMEWFRTDTGEKWWHKISGTWEKYAIDHYKGTYATFEALTAAVPVGRENDYAIVDSGVGGNPMTYYWDISDTVWKIGSAKTDSTIIENSVNPVAGGAVYSKIQDITTEWLEEIPTGSVNGINQSFTVTSTPLNAAALIVFVNGIQRKGAVLSGKTFTLDFAPTIGSTISVKYLTKAIQVLTILAVPVILVLDRIGANGILIPKEFSWTTNLTVQSVRKMPSCSTISVTIDSVIYNETTLVGIMIPAGTVMYLNEIGVVAGKTDCTCIITMTQP